MFVGLGTDVVADAVEKDAGLDEGGVELDLVGEDDGLGVRFTVGMDVLQGDARGVGREMAALKLDRIVFHSLPA